MTGPVPQCLVSSYFLLASNILAALRSHGPQLPSLARSPPWRRRGDEVRVLKRELCSIRSGLIGFPLSAFVEFTRAKIFRHKLGMLKWFAKNLRLRPEMPESPFLTAFLRTFRRAPWLAVLPSLARQRRRI